MNNCIGDILLSFNNNDAKIPPRFSSLQWHLVTQEKSWKFHALSTDKSWKGYPSMSVQVTGWKIWLLGELYGNSQKGDIQKELLQEVANDPLKAHKLNGHFLMLAWNSKEKEWHLWTDRFGTIHAYYGSYGKTACISTFFAAVSAATAQRKLDWIGLAGFFYYGFFLQDKTYFEGVRILRPASHYIFNENGNLTLEERYWQWWHQPDDKRSFEDTITDYGDIFKEVMHDLLGTGKIAIPVSGGLDSRNTIAVIPKQDSQNLVNDRLWSYSYGYSKDSVETNIARQVAAKRALPFREFIIKNYLFDSLDTVGSCVEGFQDITQCRQASVINEIIPVADYLIAAHWGDVWMDDMGLVGQNQQNNDPMYILNHTITKLKKDGYQWLFTNIHKPGRIPEGPENILQDIVQAELNQYDSIRDPDFRVKAFKTDQWSFRWTAASLRMFQPAAFPRLPFYDTRMTDFFCTVPSNFVCDRQMQIEYLKRYAPDLARITWQSYDTNLFRYQHFNTWLLPKRILKKTLRFIKFTRVVERNWEVQFLNKYGQKGLKKWLCNPDLLLHEFISPGAIEQLLESFFRDPFKRSRGYIVSMLLTFSVWLKHNLE